MTRQSARWRQRLAVACLAPLVLIGGIELVLRVLGYSWSAPALSFEFPNRLANEAQGLEGHLQRSETRFWSLRPGAELQEGDRINRYGLRGPERELAADAGVFRVALLGDSSTFGVSQRWSDTFGAQLQEELERLHPGAPVEVVNGGVPGYSVYQGSVLFDELVTALEPDAVVLYYGAWNDFNPAFGASDEQRALAGPRAKTGVERIYGASQRLRLMQAIAAHWGGTLRYRRWRERVDEWMNGEPREGYRVPPDEFRRLYRGLLERCAQGRVRAVAIVPELNQARRDEQPLNFERLDRYRELVRSAAVEAGVTTVDLRTLFRGERYEELYADLIHTNPDGNRRLALALAREFEAWHWWEP